MKPEDGPRFTVAICTWNRAAELALLLSDLECQATIHDGEVEVLIVDNRSSDGTSALLATWQGRLTLRSVREEGPGIAFARNRALSEARGEVLIFLDDDVRLRPEWLVAYRRLFADEKLQAAAGPVYSRWPARVPGWIGDITNPPFPGVTVHFVPSTERCELRLDGPLPFTANLAFRSIAGRAIGFREDLGHVGGKMIGGEDMDFARRFIERFGPMEFDPSPAVDHPVAPRRLKVIPTFGYLYRGAMAEALYTAQIPGRRIGPIPVWVFGEMLRSVGQVVTGALLADSQRVVRASGRIVVMCGLARGILATRTAR